LIALAGCVAEVRFWLAGIWLLSLFCEYQFIVAGDSEAIGDAVMQNDDFV
jgi:hypothetical protein